MKNLLMATAIVLLAAGTAQANCIYPRGPESIPDGNTATMDEMVAAQAAVKQFNDDVNAYNACLDLEMQSLAASGNYDAARLEELQMMQAKKNNSAVDAVQAVADRFNEQIRVFKERNKKK